MSERITKIRRVSITETRTTPTTIGIDGTTKVTEVHREERETDGDPLADMLRSIAEKARRARTS